jgi:hypothetical protein
MVRERGREGKEKWINRRVRERLERRKTDQRRDEERKTEIKERKVHLNVFGGLWKEFRVRHNEKY